jgi:hypothetical protein
MWENRERLCGWHAIVFFGERDVVARSAVRSIACAGMLTTGLLMGGTGIAFADTDDAAGAGPGSESVAVAGSAEIGSDTSATGRSSAEPPTSTVGNGREGVEVKPAEDDKKKIGSPVGAKKPKGGSVPASGCPGAALFFTALQIPVLALGQVLAAMQPPPAPSPAPGPAFRTQEQAPPVADSGGGGVDPLAAGVAAEPPVLQAPMVVASLPIPLPRAPRSVAPLGTAPEAGPTHAGDVVAAGARAPLIRGSLTTNAEPPARTMTPVTGEPTQLGYPRYLRSPTPGELALAALPGAAGLVVLTLSGGLIGYRQANAARIIRPQSAERFLR